MPQLQPQLELRPEIARHRIRQEVDAELRSALAGTVWQAGCTSWCVDENGHNPIWIMSTSAPILASYASRLLGRDLAARGPNRAVIEGP